MAGKSRRKEGADNGGESGASVSRLVTSDAAADNLNPVSQSPPTPPHPVGVCESSRRIVRNAEAEIAGQADSGKAAPPAASGGVRLVSSDLAAHRRRVEKVLLPKMQERIVSCTRPGGTVCERAMRKGSQEPGVNRFSHGETGLSLPTVSFEVVMVGEWAQAPQLDNPAFVDGQRRCVFSLFLFSENEITPPLPETETESGVRGSRDRALCVKNNDH
jgi:hypothetical protein